MRAWVFVRGGGRLLSERPKRRHPEQPRCDSARGRRECGPSTAMFMEETVWVRKHTGPTETLLPFLCRPTMCFPPPPPRAGRKEVRVSPGSDPMSLLTSQWEDRAGPQLAAVWGLHSSGSQLPSPARELCKALSPFYCILFIKLNCILFIKLWSAGGYGVQVWVSDRMSVLHCVPPATPFPVTSGTDPPSLGPPCVR